MEEGNGLYFNLSILWKPRHFDRRSGRGFCREIGGIGFIDLTEVSHILQEDRRLHHILQTEALGLQ